jgi:hypothetical protein
MLPEAHPKLKARCRGGRTLSTKVDGETNRWLARRAKMAGVSKAEVIRRVLDYYREYPEEVNREVDL